MNLRDLFIDKSKTLIVNTDLALVLGDLNEAIILNQLNYWLEINKKADKNFIDGKYWVYNSYAEWRENDFPYWSEKTIQRTFTRLENKGIVISANYNKMCIDKTKWYSIDFEVLEEMIKAYDSNKISEEDKMSCREGQYDRPIPKNTTKDYSYAFPKGKGTLCFSPEKAVGQSNVKYRIDDVPYLIGQYAEPNTPGSRIIELRNIIQYFISRYEEESDIRHIDVSDSAIKSIVDAYFHPTGKVVDCEAEDYMWMIDDYFATDYKMNGKRVVKSLQHFFSGKIRENIYMKRI
nr:MAG TPA: hypothetical protein [Bacteriophage sp.]